MAPKQPSESAAAKSLLNHLGKAKSTFLLVRMIMKSETLLQFFFFFWKYLMREVPYFNKESIFCSAHKNPDKTNIDNLIKSNNVERK